MKQARVTLPTFYESESCLGHKDLSARNGHYFEAKTEYELNKKIEEFVIKEKKPVDVQEWPSGKYVIRIIPTT